ncbi:hypothetical protein ACIBG0_33645 [Nocardia sp. NPDC050630]|uniref:hypothetical protein n=1 Tax=Nocardia sp. NPDC050630 TaxID=3364321 RepID=UPI0037BAF97E
MESLGPSRVVVRRFWELVGAGVGPSVAGPAVGLSQRTGCGGCVNVVGWHQYSLIRSQPGRGRAAGLSVHDVARRLGYHDAAGFSRAYRRWNGTNAGEHRQLLTSSPQRTAR